jgi:xanthine dehydrogenase accessory factor
MTNIYKTVLEYIKKGESVVLASVVKQSGSTPRGTGAKMIIRKKGEIIGTIGGGVLEKKVQEMAADLFKTGKSVLREFVLNESDIAKLGMICGGNITVYLQYISSADAQIKNIYGKISEVYDKNMKAWLVTFIEKDGENYRQYCCTDNNMDDISADLDIELKRYLVSQNIFFDKGDSQYFIEPLTKVSKAFIFGGGHVGLEIAMVLKRLEFKVIVADDREEFANPQRFPMADDIICEDMSSDALFNKLEIDENSYIIIVTRGHMYDGEVLAKAMGTNAAYIGMIGSRGKRDQIYNNLLTHGYDSSDFEKVHSPIGVSIKAETPAEIAISIAAELIQVRAEKNV